MPRPRTRSRARRSEMDLSLQVSGVPQLSSPVAAEAPGSLRERGRHADPELRLAAQRDRAGLPGRRPPRLNGLERLPDHLRRQLRGGHRRRGGRQPADPRGWPASTARPARLHPRTWFGPARIDGRAMRAGSTASGSGAAARRGDDARSGAARRRALGLSAAAQHRREGEACVGYDDRVMHELDVDAVAGVRRPTAPASRGRARSTSRSTSTSQRRGGAAGDLGSGGRRIRPIRDLALTFNDLGVPIP